AEDNSRHVAAIVAQTPERFDLNVDRLLRRVEASDDRWGLWGNPGLETLAVLDPQHPRVQRAWREISRLIRPSTGTDLAEHGNGQPQATERGATEPHPQTYLAIAYAAAEAEQVLWLIKRDLDWMARADETFFDRDFVRHVARRLGRDSTAAASVRSAVLARETTDTDA